MCGLISSISELAPGGTLKDGQTRVRCTVTLIDGTVKKDGEKPIAIPVTVFLDKPSNNSDPAAYAQLQDAFKNKKAVSFFNIQGKQSQSNEGST